MQETLSTTIRFTLGIGAELHLGYTPIYTPVFRQSLLPAPLQRAQSAFDAHQASVISPREARTLALLTAPQRQGQGQDTHSFEELLKALTLGRAAAVELPETRLPAQRPRRVRRGLLPQSKAAGQEQQGLALNWT